MREDGTGRQKVSAETIDAISGTSPDGQWVAATAHLEQENSVQTAYSTSGAAPMRIYSGTSRLRWSLDGRRVYLSIFTADAAAGGIGRTYVLPLPKGSMLPHVPVGGFRSEAEVAAFPGVEILPDADVAPGPSPAVYAFSRETVTRNLYRIPLP
jgi:hypothetical protein